MSALVYPGQEQDAWGILGDLRRRVGSLEATPAGGVTPPSTGIAFDTDNEGGYLEIHTNDPHPNTGLGKWGFMLEDTSGDGGTTSRGITVQESGDGAIYFENAGAGSTIDSGTVYSFLFKNDGDGLFEIHQTGADGVLVQNDGDGAIELRDTGDGGILIDTSGVGFITLSAIEGTKVITDGSISNTSLYVGNGSTSTATTVYGERIEATSLYAGASLANTYGLDVFAYMQNGQSIGIHTDAISVGARNAYGGYLEGTCDGTGDSVGAFLRGDASGGTGAYGAGAYGAGEADASNTATVGGAFSSSKVATGSPSAPALSTLLTHALPSTAVAAYARGGGATNALGILVDVHSTGGTAYVMRAWTGSGAGSEVFRIDADGTVHIKTGSTFVADL